MNILITGANGYIGKSLLLSLLNKGHFITCCVRDKKRFQVPPKFDHLVSIIEIDFLNDEINVKFPTTIDVAFYLIHSMSTHQDFDIYEQKAAIKFKQLIQNTTVKQVIYLSGIANGNNLSKHLASRLAVENTLKSDSYSTTTLRAGIIIGSGSASFEIIRDLVEKLPFMITPKWLLTRCQPIAIQDVIEILSRIMLNERTYNQHYDIGGSDILTYKEMLLTYASVRNLRRYLIILPVLTPRISSYWLYFVTSTSFKLAKVLVDSMKVEVVCENDEINKILNYTTMDYKTALEKTFKHLNHDSNFPSWKTSYSSGQINKSIDESIDVPIYGCFKDQRQLEVNNTEETIEKIWKIGGINGWYHANWLWKIRGFLDKLAGGVGLNRGRRNQIEIQPGDSIDFWRVLQSDKNKGYLLLYAEMKLPGEAWLEFKINGQYLQQTATFRPKGVIGRLYWYMVLPFHGYIFKGMLRSLCS